MIESPEKPRVSEAPLENPTMNPRVPELLAPAGDWECAKAAVENGADAIYFGLDRFNARMRATNFTAADLPELMEFLHRRGVRGYVTFNTLVFENELADAEQFLRSIIAAGVDAAIVQDVGVARLIRRLSPDFPIHASTQMTISSAGGVEFARELGCNLVVLARECSLKEIEEIQRSQPSADQEQLPLEVFVHGALCVAYSGQCLTSESLGGRSANRGECAQACRMPYELVSDGETLELGDRRYLLSPQDLSGIDVLPDLVKSGVVSLKIEGRLKSPEYVANITRVYREALRKLGGDSVRLDDEDRSTEAARYDLEMGFSRGLYSGWFRGIDNRELAHARFAKKRGVYLGEIKGVKGQVLLVDIDGALKAGDGVVIDTGTGDDNEQGGRVFSLHSKGRLTQICFRHGQIDPRRVRDGDKLWKTNDPELDRRVRKTFAGDEVRFQRPIRLEVHGHEGAPMTVIARDEQGRVAEVASKLKLEKAEKHPMNDGVLKKQLGRLGGTPFRLGSLDNRLEGEVILSMSELNQLRRQVVQKLDQLRSRPLRWELRGAPSPASQVRGDHRPDRQAAGAGVRLPQLIVLARTLPQLEAALDCGVSTVYCDFENPKDYRTGVRLHRERKASGGGVAGEIFVAPPRIFKPGEEGVLRSVRACDADGYLVRNYECLTFFEGERKVGDFSLNVANSLTAEYFLDRYGLEFVTASYDLNIVQLEALLGSGIADRLEITIHQHMPMFHMEHCVFCAFMSEGKDYRDCGRPCDDHDVKLRDRVGMEHPLKADVGCRNTVFNSQAQTGAEFVSRFIELGARRFRVEFLNDSPEQVKEAIGKYRELLAGEIDGRDLWRDLKLKNQLGVTRGQMSGA
ncbi:MAG: putative protease [Limisphaerales bacterium]|jgi:putative protease